jgi:hypothetical protein
MSMTIGTQEPAARALRADYPALPTFGWLLLAGIGQALVIPAPWTLTAAYRFLCRNISLPDGRRLSFSGQPGDIWYVIVAAALVPLISQVGGHVPAIERAGGAALLLHLLVMVVHAWLIVLIMRWFVANVKTEDGRLSLVFGGSTLGYIGWQLLLIFSVITIIGWAWVGKFFMRWVCRSVTGDATFDFSGSGLSILWRTVVFILGCGLIIPIPWMLRWLSNWYVSQITVADLRH